MLHDLDLLWLRIQHLEKETSWKQLLREFGFPAYETMLFPYENNETKQRDQEVLLLLVLPMDIKHIVVMYLQEMYAISNEHLESLIQHVDAFNESILLASVLKLERDDVVSCVDSAI